MLPVLRNHDKKFDMQLLHAHARESAFASMFGLDGCKIELKSESWLWEKTGNICIEFENAGKPSGIAATEADWWVHELLDRSYNVVSYRVMSVPRLKELCRRKFNAGSWRSNSGDGGRFKVVLLALRTLDADLLSVSIEGAGHDLS